MTAETRYNTLCNAIQFYNALDDEEKQQASESYNKLQMQIKAYNSDVEVSNEEHMDASELALGAIISFNMAFLAALWFALKKKFMI